MTENNLPAVFNFQNHEVRTITDEAGNPWWVAKDGCDILGYINSNDAIKRHCRGVVKHYPILDGLGREQETRIINESNLYRLISGSKLPSAVKFEEWIFEEVLPTIRKTGSYNAAPTDPMTLLNDPAAMRTLLLTYTEKVIAQETEIKTLTPKAEALDRISTADGCMCFTNAAKSLQVRPKDLFDWLQSHRWIYRRVGGSGWLAYQDKIQTGYLSHKVTTVSRSDGSEKVVEQALVTAKGLSRLAEIFPAKMAA